MLDEALQCFWEKLSLNLVSQNIVLGELQTLLKEVEEAVNQTLERHSNALGRSFPTLLRESLQRL